MRTYPTAFTTAISKKSLAPITLIKIELATFGGNPALTLRLAQTKDTGSPVFSTGVLDWRNMIVDVSDIVQPVNANTGFINADARVDVEILNTITALFSPAARFSSILWDYKPDTSLVSIYQWFEGEGLAEADINNESLLMFKGILISPTDYDEAVCRFQVAQLSSNYGGQVIGRTVNLTDYPSAPNDSIGNFITIPVGVCPKVPAIPVHDFAETVLTSVLLKAGTVANVADTTGFPASGTFIIDGQELTYTGLTATTFTGVSGHTTHHYKGSVAAEKLTDYPFLLLDPNYPCESIGNVYADGHLVAPGDITKDLVNGKVTFTKRPQFNDKNDSQFLNVHPDVADASNNALNPLNAIDPDTTTGYAEINQVTPVLAVKQTDSLPNIGEISRVLIQVVHFEEEKIPTDTITVDVLSGGNVGSLNKPAVDDTLALSGNPDFTSSVVETLAFTFGGDSHLHTGEGSSSSITEDNVTSVDTSGNGSMAGSQFQMTSSGPTATLQVNFPTAPAGVTQADYEFLGPPGNYAGFETFITATAGAAGDKVEVYMDFGGGVEEILTQLSNINSIINVVTGDTIKFSLSGAPSTNSPTIKIRKTGSKTITDWTILLQNIRRTLHFPDDLAIDNNTTGGANTKSGTISDITASVDLGPMASPINRRTSSPMR